MKNKNLILFIVIGFIVTTALWGFVGGCGTSNIAFRKESGNITEEGQSAEGVILDETSAPVKGITYVVNPGDTLWNISKKYNVSVSYIKFANKLEKDTISAGQRLIIPVVKIPQEAESAKTDVAEAKQGTVIYKVRKNDSLWRIAQTCGTTIEQIAQLNGLSKDAKLTPGQEILVPSNE